MFDETKAKLLCLNTSTTYRKKKYAGPVEMPSLWDDMELIATILCMIE